MTRVRIVGEVTNTYKGILETRIEATQSIVTLMQAIGSLDNSERNELISHAKNPSINTFNQVNMHKIDSFFKNKYF